MKRIKTGYDHPPGGYPVFVPDLHRRRYRKTGIVAVPVRHPNMEGELGPVVSRPGKGRTSWDPLTNETIGTVDDASRVVMACARRRQVEMRCRACRTELAMESPRPWFWGKSPQAAAVGQPGICLLALLAGAAPRPSDRGTAHNPAPQNRREEPPGCDTPLRTQGSSGYLIRPSKIRDDS